MIVADTEVEFLLDGINYQDIYLNLIDNAQGRIVLHTYIFELDEFGKRVFEGLLGAAKRGVSVSFIVDGFGTKNLGKEYLMKMNKVGVKYYKFNKIRWGSIHKWGRRLHHKILVVDGHDAIAGGINIITPFDKRYKEPRLDFAFYLKGSIALDIEEYCSQVLAPFRKKKFKVKQSIDKSIEFVRYSINDWVYGRRAITKEYSEILDKAENEVIIINSYFFPRKKFLKKLVLASQRGVLVKLILPTFSDWQSHVLATEFLYSYLLKNNIQIYQWDKSILHGKMAMVDRKFTMLGSFNLHYTSFQGNLEMNIEVLSKALALEIGNEIDQLIIKRCKKIDKSTFEDTSVLLLRIKRFMYYHSISIVSNFLLGYIHQEDIDKEEKVSKAFSILRIFVSFFAFFLGVLGLVLPIIPGIILIIISFLIIYPIIIKNYKSL